MTAPLPIMNHEFNLVCPICRSSLTRVAPGELHCARDATALPFADLTGAHTRAWKIRAASFCALIARLFASNSRALTVLDLGAGNGWLAHQLAKRGHRVAAVDLLTNVEDGLGAHVHYAARFVPLQTEFDHLPLGAQQFDVAIFNSSLHYSTDYAITLGEVWRVTKRDGCIVILDTPIYRAVASGKQMVAERQKQFQTRFGFPSNALASENFLTHARLKELAQATNITWRVINIWHGWRWALRPWLARWRGTREPAEFSLIIGRRKTNE
ncbi:MAG: class I SAM-dependent methyltransferase [Chloroflexi bacterium]|nr:class I SAM-dependent methyltransferase [Chloroflexota bacterium]